jgi:hypothetical protein
VEAGVCSNLQIQRGRRKTNPVALHIQGNPVNPSLSPAGDMMTVDSFTCYVCKSDLTEFVIRAVFGAPVPIVESQPAAKKTFPARWRVVVSCPTDTVQNVFSSDGGRTGKPADTSDLFWTKALEQIDVRSSQERIDSFAKFLLGMYAVVGTTLGGAGLLTESSFDPARIQWIVLALAPMTLSFALAVVSITPKYKTFNPADLDSVSSHYTSILKSRGRAIFWSGIFFAVSLLLAVPAFWLSHATTRPC